MLGADWRHPTGLESNLDGIENHPVVHLAFRDVEAYAKWAGTTPAEVSGSSLARGGAGAGAEFAWGDQLHPGGRHMANTCSEFPCRICAVTGMSALRLWGRFRRTDTGSST